MAEIECHEVRFYLTPNLHTEHLQEASRDLLEQNLKVADSCVENLQLLSPELDSEVVHTRVKQLVNPRYIPKRILAEWTEKENWVSRMMVSVKAMSYPERTDRKLGEHLHSIDQFTAVEAALGFFYTAEERLKKLLLMNAPQQLSFLGYSAFAYTESRILRKAVFHGVYLTNPDTKITVTPLNIYSN